MASRFTESEKWRDKWFRRLSPGGKLLFLYLIDNCDLAGFIELDTDSAEFDTGLSREQIEAAVKEIEKCFIRKDDWLWIKKFIRYQKNMNLNPDNNAHKKIISILQEQLGRFSLKEYSEELGAIEGLFMPPCKGNGSSSGKGSVEKPKSEKISFDEFWELYGKKVGDKDKLRKKWDGLTLETQKQIMQYIPLYKISKPDKQFMRDPQTFLNNKTWNDEIIMDKKNGVIIPFTTWKSNGTKADSQVIEYDPNKERAKMKHLATGKVFEISKYDLEKQYSQISQ